GMYLLVNPTGRYFRLDYRHDGKRKTLALGVYPDVSLKQARERREEARRLLAEGVDPGERRKEEKAAASTDNSFEGVARLWIDKMVRPSYTEKHTGLVTSRLERDVFPLIGSKDIRELRASDILEVLGRMEKRGVLVSAKRVRQIIGQVCRYAVSNAKADFDPTTALRGALPPTQEKHRATITNPQEIGELLRAIDGYKGSFVTLCALKLAPMVMVRPGELRHAEWTEFDLDNALWTIPGEKMKMKGKHVVPLSRQAVVILREIQPLTGSGKYVFPGALSDTRPMSENTVLYALRRLGYPVGTMTGHGFRSMASTILNEQGWHRDAIERQLAHGERDSVRAAYNHAEHMPVRKEMMQHWSDYLDQLAGRNVVAMKASTV
ncbi:MAG: tyrosine-type recombinase/integrase, partial [Magnetococcales bacterium]|nr:tyrosine-type recombinase/integrase [Magnetococcales bacterium]